MILSGFTLTCGVSIVVSSMGACPKLPEVVEGGLTPETRPKWACLAWVKGFLGDGPRKSKEFDAAGLAAGFSTYEIVRCTSELKLERFLIGHGKERSWWIKLPDPDSESILEALLKAVKERDTVNGLPVRQVPLERVTEWVSEHLLDSVFALKKDDVPSAEALALWLWAKDNQTEYRKLYDSKRMRVAPRGTGSAAPRKNFVPGSGQEAAARLLKGREPTV